MPYPLTSPIPGPQGVSGAQGIPGAQGSPGPSGYSIVAEIISASLIQCPNGGNILLIGTDINNSGVFALNDTNIQSTVICNGQNAFTSPYSIVSLITPCGPNSSAYKENLLLLSDGSVLADFSDSASGLNTRLSLIPDGAYIDTDDSYCQFTLSTVGSTRTISWQGGSQSWTMAGG